MKPKVVLAYSGGLDTSVLVRWLSEAGYQVVAFCADVGQGENLAPIKKRAFQCGATQVVVRNLQAPFAKSFVLPALKAGAIYEGQYLLATALSRPLIAQGLADVAKQTGAVAVAHGCTGKGNDQVRLEVSLQILAPKLKVLAPVREWELKSRDAEVAYAKAQGLKLPAKKDTQYSIDQNLWGVSIESGPLENPWTEPPDSAYRWTKSPAKAPAKPALVRIDFRRGVPVGLNGKAVPLVSLIQRLNKLGAQHGVGRADMIEDRLVGIKSREVYEAPAATILHAAHQALEALTLDRETLDVKATLAQRYARLIYDGLWFTPLKAAIDGFVDSTQSRVTGTVRMKLSKGTAQAVGRRSPNSLYKERLATYSGKDDFDQTAAKGFIQLWGLPYKKQ